MAPYQVLRFGIQSGPGNDGNEEVLSIPDMQSVYSTAPADWARERERERERERKIERDEQN